MNADRQMQRMNKHTMLRNNVLNHVYSKTMAFMIKHWNKMVFIQFIHLFMKQASIFRPNWIVTFEWNGDILSIHIIVRFLFSMIRTTLILHYSKTEINNIQTHCMRYNLWLYSREQQEKIQ